MRYSEGMMRSVNGADWRWQAARSSSNGGGVARERDALVGGAAAYDALTADDEAVAAERYPEIDLAVRLWSDEAVADRLRILAIANVPVSDIATRLGVSEAAVEVAEGLFFDVRLALNHRSWIGSGVIARIAQAGRHDLALRLRLAYAGGPAVAEALLDGDVDFPLDETERLADREVRLHLKVREALERPLGSPSEVNAFLKIALPHVEKMERLRLERAKFEHRAAVERQERGMTEKQARPTESPSFDVASAVRSAAERAIEDRAVAPGGLDGEVEPPLSSPRRATA